jgi:hypothetical protein
MNAGFEGSKCSSHGCNLRLFFNHATAAIAGFAT